MYVNLYDTHLSFISLKNKFDANNGKLRTGPVEKIRFNNENGSLHTCNDQSKLESDVEPKAL